MARSERRLRIKRRLQGLAFLAVVALLLGLTVAIYNKSLPWQAADRVTLDVDRIGTQLVVPADIKLEGIIVGRVSGASTNGDTTRLTLQISKSWIDRIPPDVVARILPKTLFGEKYVDLIIPPGSKASPSRHLEPGTTIPQDRSTTAIELQKVFNDLIPMLRALKPAELSIALSNLSQALQGRGDALGKNFELVNTYFSKFNTDLPNFNHDIAALADLASNYADATPDLLATLHNFTVNAKTFTAKQDVYAQFLVGSQGFANEATKVFGDNANRLITLAKVSKPVLDLYATYSPVLECLPNGLAIYDRTRLEQAFGAGPFLHITLTPVGDRGAYTAQDVPLKSDLTSFNIPPTAQNGEGCYGLPYGNHGLHPVNSAFPGPHPSGNYACAGTPPNPACPGVPGGPPTPATRTGVGSTAEQNLLSGLFGPVVGAQVTDTGLEDLLLGPMLRGMNVQVST